MLSIPRLPFTKTGWSCPVVTFFSLVCISLVLVLLGVIVREKTRMSPYQAFVVASAPPLNQIYSVERQRSPFIWELYKTSVPRTLWQTCKSHEGIPALATQLFQSWSSYNPTYDHILLDDAEIEDFVLRHYNQTVLDAFKDMPLGVMRADVFRYMAIYFHGGVYADMDTECKKPIETWVKPQCQLVVAVQDDQYFCQWSFAGVAGHPALKSVLDLVLQRMVHKTVPQDDPDYVFKVTGPGVFTEGLRGYLDLSDGEELRSFVGESGKKMRGGVCLISRAHMKRSLRNMYSSTNQWLQGGSWSGWLAAQDNLRNSSGPSGDDQA